MRIVNFESIIFEAWNAYDPSKKIKSVQDVSARVSTNHVYKLSFEDDTFIIAKLSYFGFFRHFREDHTIIANLANNLPSPFENFLARSLMKKGEVFIYRKQEPWIDAWVVFYRPVQVANKPPQRFSEEQIEKLGEQLALFHQACADVTPSLPDAEKTLRWDIRHLLDLLASDRGKFEHRNHEDFIREQCDFFFMEMDTLQADEEMQSIPVFIDWNIGNFSVTDDFNFFSRWDYDWFRMSSRVMDFYFMSRVVSDVGDQTDFSYVVDVLMEERFIRFLKAYHAVYPLTEREIRFIKVAYRFFILNYVIKDGRYFFHEIYASRLQHEAYVNYLPSLDEKFDPDRLIQALNL